MKFETAAVYAREEVLAQPRDQNCQRAEAGHEERDQENPPVLETSFQQPAITHTESLEGWLKTLLNSSARRWAGGRNIRFFFFPAQKLLRHGRDDRAGEQIRRQHSENHCFGERHKEVARNARQ